MLVSSPGWVACIVKLSKLKILICTAAVSLRKNVDGGLGKVGPAIRSRRVGHDVVGSGPREEIGAEDITTATV